MKISIRWGVRLAASVAALVMASGCSSDPVEPGAGDADAGVGSPTADAGQPGVPFQSGLEVNIEGGTVAGAVDGDLRIFRGIPYAAPPVGALRFRDPAPVLPWTGVRDATEWGTSCPQLDAGPLGASLVGPGEISEDCLQLNVWAYDDAKPRAVMVFIHGGAFFAGAGSQELYEAEALARRGDLVVVTINYRLGALGYLATPALAAEAGSATTAGNYGLKDQIAALGWVQRNISAFGGDASNVTVFGESAGGISICAMMGTPAADGLYHKAIVQSGVGCNAFPTAMQSTALAQVPVYEASADLVEKIGCADAADEVACLRAASVDDLVASVNAAELILGGVDKALPTSPYVDGKWMTEQPIERIRRGDIDVPTIIGTVKDEATLFFGSVTILSRIDLRYQVARIVGDDTLAGAIVDLYPFLEFPIAKDAFLALVTDVGFSCPNLAVVDAMKAGAPVFAYEFQRVAPGFYAMGSFHALDLPYVFDNFGALAIVPTSADRATSDEMQRAWTSFANSGVPALSSTWPAFAGTNGSLAVLDATPSLMTSSEFRNGRCAALAELGLQF